MTCPPRTVRDALDRRDCDPTGPDHKFVARCPAHDDRTPSLSVTEGLDGRALLHCFAGCDTADIITALGLAWTDLFPEGHRSGRPHKVLAKPRELIDLVLDVLRELEIDYSCTRNVDFWTADRCPACDLQERAVLWIQRDGRRVRFSCFNGCEQTDVLAALAGDPS